MKEGNPAAGYVLLVLLVLLLGLVIATVARDISGGDDTIQVAEPAVEAEKQVQQPAAHQPKPKQPQGRIWEGTM